MPNFNSVTLVGHLTRDPMTKTAGETQIADFGIVVSEKFKDKERVCFIDCTAFGKLAEIVGKYCNKGKPVLVRGKLRQETWEDKNGGGKRSKHTIVVDELQMLGGRQDSQKEVDPAEVPF